MIAKFNSNSNVYKWRSNIFNTSIFNIYFTNKEIQTTFKSDVLAVQCPKEYIGIVGFGQSNIANHVIREKLIDYIEGVYMWDWTNGNCYPYSEPLVGTDGNRMGNVLSDMAINLRDIYVDQPILIAPMARNGSSVFHWYNGKQKYRLNEFLRKSKEMNLNFSYWIWLQGETDAIPKLHFPNKTVTYNSQRVEINQQYNHALNKIFDKIKFNNPSVVFGVSLTSKCNNNGNKYVRLGQKNIIRDRIDTFLTIDTDDLNNQYRSDGCHFNFNGAKLIGKALSDFVKKTLPVSLIIS